MKVKIVIVLMLLFSVSVACAGDLPEAFGKHLKKFITAPDLFSMVEHLSGEQFEGRLSGTGGYDRAAAWAADIFAKSGLLSLTPGYYQDFPIDYTKVYESELKVYLTDKDGKEEIVEGKYFKNYFPLNYSGSGEVEARIIFAGYGLVVDKYGHDDYKGIDVRDKIVLVYRGKPKGRDGEDWSEYDTREFRARLARERGALAIMFISKPMGAPSGEHIQGFPILFVHENLGKRILKEGGKEAKVLKKAMTARENVSFATGIKAYIRVKSELFQGKGRNVIAYIPGSDESVKDEFIVVGAHLDHNGMWPELMPGADDNASGSAVVVSVARALAGAPVKPRRSILFILFAGEEMGLLGSEYFVSNLPSGVEKIKFVFNMDMVGAGVRPFMLRLKNYPDVEEVVTGVPGKLGLGCRVTGNKVDKPRRRGGADHAPFVKVGIPAVSIFGSGGKHHGYHTSEDTVYWITPKVMEVTGLVVAYSAMVLATK